MYEKSSNESRPTQSEHLEIAEKMAHEIIENNNHEQQNEMIAAIKSIIVANRKVQIEEANKKLEVLKHSLDNLMNFDKVKN
jgi:hypothetical protein